MGESSNPRATHSKQQVEAVIRSARLSVHFQPIVDLHDGLIVAYEALTRVDRESGFDNPGELFEAAAEYGLLWELEAITRRNSLEAAANWPSHVRLFLNCTPAVFADPRFAAQLSDDLSTAPDLRPDRIVLEITELSDDQHIPGLTEQVRAATAAGFNVALDDAGAGASGLNRMMSLRPQWVKLDREFVRGIDTDQLRQNLVRFFVHFARLSGVSVVAEGLESAKELQTVTTLGVRYAQGFYLARPGTRDQTMDPQLVSEVRTRWASVEASVPQEMLEPTLGAVCRPTGVCRSDCTAGEAMIAASRSSDQPGVLVFDGIKPIGWAPKAALEGASADTPLRSFRTRFAPVATFAATLTVNEAVTAICTRDDERLPDPVVVTSGEQVVGIVRLRDLIRIAATEGQLAASGRARLTGLPTRTRADQHMAEVIRTVAAAPGNANTHHDAAFVDLRSFADYNSHGGSVKGDRLIRDLAELISAVVLSTVHDAFVAHLGDDRFLLTARPATLLPRLHALASAYDGQQAEDTESADAPTLRALYLPGVLATAHHPRDVYRAEQRLREMARERDARARVPGSYVCVQEDIGGLRRAA